MADGSPGRAARRSTRLRATSEEPDSVKFVSPLPARPSQKALGKRPQLPPPTIPPVAPLLPPPSTDEPATRKATRVLPERVSRKSQNTLMVDELLRDYEQRAAGVKTSVPSTTSFLLTTDASTVPPPRAPNEGPSYTRPTPRKPSVQRASSPHGEPDFVHLTAATSVGSRLRARGTHEAVADTSDAAYLSRHKRFEALEKRQRLREKEKIQHERYKLKERIDQLRSMPREAFVRPNLNSTTGASSSSDSVAEGERIRRELLREAEELEKRYDLLLSSHHTHTVEEVRPPPSLTLKIRLGSSGTRTPPNDGSSRPSNHNHNHHASSLHPHHTHHSTNGQSSSSRSRPSGSSKHSSRPKRASSRSISPNDSHSRKRSRPSPASSPPPLTIADIESQISTGYIPDILRVSAPSNASRVMERTVMPFGVKAPSMLDQLGDFELPEEILQSHVRFRDGDASEEGGVFPSEDETLGMLNPDDVEADEDE